MKTVTLANLAESTNQEVFDTVARGLAAQGFERAAYGGMCVYRDVHGLKCAAGQLMTDKEYAALESEQRHMGWTDLVETKAVPTAHRTLIGWLQNDHDRSASPLVMYHALKARALQLELDPAALGKEPSGV